MDQQAFYSMNDRNVLLRVKAKPHSREDGVVGVRAGELIVAVRAPAEKGRANAEIERILARALGLPRASIVLKGGAGSPHKVFQLPRESAVSLKTLAAGLATRGTSGGPATSS